VHRRDPNATADTIQEIDIPLRPGPLNPWYRFGVIDSRAAEPDEPLTDPRILRDFSLHLQIKESSWIWAASINGSLTVEPGDILFLPPGWEHAWAYSGETHLAIHFDLQRDTTLTARNDDGSYDMIWRLGGDVSPRPVRIMPVFRLHFPGQDPGEAWRIPLVTRLPNPGEWRRRLGDLVQRWEARTLDTVLSQLRIHRTLGWALEELTIQSDYSRHLAGDPRIAELIDRLADPAILAEVSTLRVTALAQRLGMGETVFRQHFRVLTGHSPHRYFRQRQVQYAMRLLRDTTLPVKRIANAIGFRDPYHFSRVFRSIAGSSPADYRRTKARR